MSGKNSEWDGTMLEEVGVESREVSDSDVSKDSITLEYKKGTGRELGGSGVTLKGVDWCTNMKGLDP